MAELPLIYLSYPEFLFLNDITSVLNNETKIMMFADDTKIWRQVSKYNDYLKLQEDINYLLEWSIKNNSLLRFTHLDHLSLITDVIPSGTGCSSRKVLLIHISIGHI